MLAFLSANGHVLSVIGLGLLTVVSEIMGLSKDPSSAKGFVDGLIKFIKALGADDSKPTDPSVPPPPPAAKA